MRVCLPCLTIVAGSALQCITAFSIYALARYNAAQQQTAAGKAGRCGLQQWLLTHILCVLMMQGEYRRAHEVKVSTDALYESELAATHQAWELVVELKKNKLIAKQQGEW